MKRWNIYVLTTQVGTQNENTHDVIYRFTHVTIYDINFSKPLKDDNWKKNKY